LQIGWSNISEGGKMQESEMLVSIEKAIREVAANPNLVVKPESRLVDDLGFESIDFLDMSSVLETSFGHEVDFVEVAEKVALKLGKGMSKNERMKSIRVQDVMDFFSAHANG
jgi:acyl carrier protein